MMTGMARLFGGQQRREVEAPTGSAIVFGPEVRADGKKFIPVSEERGWRGEPLGMLVVDGEQTDFIPVPQRPPLRLVLLAMVVLLIVVEVASRARRG